MHKRWIDQRVAQSKRRATTGSDIIAFLIDVAVAAVLIWALMLF